MDISFFVAGVPAPGGSKRAFVNRKSGKAIVVEDCKRNKPWREAVKYAALEASFGIPCSTTCPIFLSIVFVLPRPKSHYRTGSRADELRDNAPTYHTGKPDATKLLRSTEDALTDAGIWRDDSQVSCQQVGKVYGVLPGAYIEISDKETRLDQLKVRLSIRKDKEDG